jgi:hypothetical protein
LDGSVGQRFARWALVGFVERTAKHGERWEAECSCGTRKVVFLDNLRRGLSGSCGCLNRERQRDLHTTHGHAPRSGKSPLYRCWRSMVARCCNANCDAFRYYGGRGITVCDRWRGSFEAFAADMGEMPSPKHEIDRIDTNGHYEPANCRWRTHREQMWNVRTNVMVEYRGETRCIAEWCAILGRNVGTIRSRLKRGMSVEEAFTLPQRKSPTRVQKGSIEHD